MSGQDLALLRLEASDMPTLGWGTPSRFRWRQGSHRRLSGRRTRPRAAERHGQDGSVCHQRRRVGFKQDRANQPVIQIDAPAAWGNSGGPALNDAGDVVGVLTFVPVASDTDRTVQGFNFVIPAAAVARFLEGTVVPRQEASRFNAAWHAGLRHYFLGNHRRARSHLAEANRLLPELPDVRRVVADNDARLARQPWLAWRKIGVGLLVLCGAGYTALIVRHWRRTASASSSDVAARRHSRAAGDP